MWDYRVRTLFRLADGLGPKIEVARCCSIFILMPFTFDFTSGQNQYTYS